MTEVPAPGPDGRPATAPYRVLARKYRPTGFAELIGQDALVRTLSNAIATGRLAHAFLLTGVRGVGKTTTARILARALNCVGPDGTGGATIEPCGVCEHCVAIAQDRHLDVIEMDAASRTGIDDIREIIDGVQYAPVSARFKIYIIDEVHMLSKAAFNGLLKTLEEPPAHVKFVFATTEIRRVPVTVLSRCQRFDLHRVPAELLTRHFAGIAEREGAQLEPQALALIARAADGSVRDGLSLLDQAIAHAGPDAAVSAATVRDMLGLADRTGIFDLFEALLRGEAARALGLFSTMYDAGADPIAVVQDLLDLTHWLTRVKVNPADADTPTIPEAERVRGRDLAGQLSMAVLTRAWQMLLKGLGEAQHAPTPRLAVDMLLVRMTYAASLPTPVEIVQRLRNGEATGSTSGNPGGNGPGGNGPGGNGPGGNGTGGGAPHRSAGSSATIAAPSSFAQGGSTPSSARSMPPSAPTTGPVSLSGSMPQGSVSPGAAMAASLPQPAPAAAPAPDRPNSFAELVALFRKNGEMVLHAQLYNNVHLVSFRPGRLVFRPTDYAPSNLSGDVAGKLSLWTGERWIVTVASDPGEPTLADQETDRLARLRREVTAHPLVQATLAAFPGAVIETIRPIQPPAVAAVAAPDVEAGDVEMAAPDRVGEASFDESDPEDEIP